jgi:hypothetical protein
MTDDSDKLWHKTNTDDMSNPQGDLEPHHESSGGWFSISVAENGQLFGC